MCALPNVAQYIPSRNRQIGKVILSFLFFLILYNPDEAFQNLHHLSILNLAYNRINQLDFASFDSVGTLSHLNLDLSHNLLNMLRINRTSSYPTSSNIMNLDLSCNNISMIEVTFFEPVQVTISHCSMTRRKRGLPETIFFIDS